MVNSRIDNKINYKESKNIDSNDIDFTSDIYKGILYKKDINFILGKPNYKYVENNIIYLNIYLVNLDRIIARIGIYEIDSTKYSRYLDDIGNIDIDRLEIPLLFKFSESFIKDKYFLKEIEITSNQESKEESKEESKGESKQDSKQESKQDSKQESKSSDFIKDKKSSSKILPTLKSQTRDESEEEKRIYYKDGETKWIEEFMTNNNYKLIDNEAGGDCLFAVIRDGLEKINKKVSVKELRMRLSQEATEEVFLNYKEQYDMFLKTYAILNTELKKIVDKNKELRDKVKI